MGEAVKSVPNLPKTQPSGQVVSASQVVDLTKVGDRPTLDEIREFVAQAAAFDGSVEVNISSWQVDPSSSNRVNPQSYETRMRVEWTPPSK